LYLLCSQAGLFIDAYLDFEICFLEFHSSSKFQISLAGVMENQKLLGVKKYYSSNVLHCSIISPCLAVRVAQLISSTVMSTGCQEPFPDRTNYKCLVTKWFVTTILVELCNTYLQVLPAAGRHSNIPGIVFTFQSTIST